MPAGSQPADTVPIPAGDPLLAATLRAATECYLRGDYRRAAELFSDVALADAERPEAHAWLVVSAALDAQLDRGALTNTDAAGVVVVEVRA